jgi:hypothetical protein
MILMRTRGVVSREVVDGEEAFNERIRVGTFTATAL